MRKTKEDTEMSRRKVVETAKSMFVEKGYTATKLSDIAKAVGMTRGVVYWHFKNKAELYDYAVMDTLEEITRSVEIELSTNQPIMAKLRELLLRTRSINGFALLFSLSPNEGPVDFVEQTYQKGEKIIELLITALTKAKRKGQIEAGVKVESIIGLMLIFMTGLSENTMSGFLKSNKMQNIEEMTDILFKGIYSYQK